MALLTRVNFLLGFGLMVMIGFYFGFRYLVVAPVSAIAPGWATYVAGAAVLAALGFTVQILANVMSSLAGIATYPQGPNATAIASQAAFFCGHGALGYGLAAWLRDGPPLTVWGLALVGALYAAGVGIGFLDWRRRRNAAAKAS